MSTETLNGRRVEIDTSDRRMHRLRFYRSDELIDERYSIDEFTTRQWVRMWTSAEVDDPRDLPQWIG